MKYRGFFISTAYAAVVLEGTLTEVEAKGHDGEIEQLFAHAFGRFSAHGRGDLSRFFDNASEIGAARVLDASSVQTFDQRCQCAEFTYFEK